MIKNILITEVAIYIVAMLVPELLRLGLKAKVVVNFIFGQTSLNHCCADLGQKNYIISNLKIEGTGSKLKVSLSLVIEELIKGYVMLKNLKYGNV